MKATTSIFRRKQRPRNPPGTDRKRRERSFASTFAALEKRALLSVVGPVSSTTASLSATTVALIESTFATSRPVGPNKYGGGGSEAVHPPMPPNNSSGSNGGGNPSLRNRPDDHVAMDVARVTVDDQATPEFALADFNSSEVFVRLGFDGSTVELGPSQGIDHPYSVTLADLNDDGNPDLIVANTNGNNILVFPGLGDGQFGPELNGGHGIEVGTDPVSITVTYAGNDPQKATLIVADKGSDEVSILAGQSMNGVWNVTSVGSIATPSEPVKTLVYDVQGDGVPDLLVCNSGSDNVTLYDGLADGSFEDVASATFAVGVDPNDLYVGQFDRHSPPDLVTINSGSDSLTFIQDPFGARPTTQTISSGGISPDAAVVVGSSVGGVMDLVVANGGDGHLAVFRSGIDGLQLAGVVTQASLQSPTALAPGSSSSDGFNLFAAGADEDAALLLHFDLGVATTFLPSTTDTSTALGQDDSELFAQLMPMADSSLELVAVFWAGSPESQEFSGEGGLREPSTITALYSPTEGQGVEASDMPAEGSNGQEPLPAKVAGPSNPAASLWDRYVVGADRALDRPRANLDAVAARDALEEGLEPPIDGLARLDLDRLPFDHRFDPNGEASSGAVDEALRLYWSEGVNREGPSTITPAPRSRPEGEGGDAPTLEGNLETVPLISSAVVISTRLILKTRSPRPSTFRKKAGHPRFVSLEHDRQAGITTNLL